MSSTAAASALPFAGGVAGVVEALVVQPLEIVKVRFQLNSGRNPSILTSARAIVAEGGALRLYRGLLPEIFGMFPTRSVMYSSNEFIKRELKLFTGGKDTATVVGLAGFVAGTPEAAVTTPFQFVKIRLSAKEFLGRYANTWDCVRQIYLQEGIQSFGTGFISTAVRNSVWNSVYFISMFHLKAIAPPPGPKGGGLAITIHSLVTGFSGGVIATACNAPFDVCKSRIQGQLLPSDAHTGGMKYTSTLQTLSKIVHEEGLVALYKGFLPKALRMGIGGGVAITTFEAVCNIIAVAA
jgi:solute carrier family 25 2-oxodicarboxylate transporter 21